ncbi:GlxA family transcriptional regulator [Rhizobium sp. SG2393]|uniref:GlxA family transcriptional regulator n=1 Tax=Rhizobium sp. SG2393 TaxID=3276279 RepID=UPI00366F7EE3
MRMSSRPRPKAPIEVSVVILPESSIMSLASVLDPMRAANRVAGRAVFRWRLLSPDGKAVTLTCGLPIPVDGAFAEPFFGEVLIVIAGFHLERHAGRRFIRRLQAAARLGGVVAGVESGCFLLAGSGLIDGRRATAHWEELEDFASRFPSLSVMADRFVIDGRFWTSGGASPTLDMMLHLIRERVGSATALDVASVFVYDETHAADDAQPLVSLGRMAAADPQLARAIQLMERTIEHPLAVSAIARRLGVSERKLDTLFARGMETSPGAYYLRLRLQAAQRLVRDTRAPISEIALRTGFDSLSAFSRAFKRSFGESPLTWRRQGQADADVAMA